ncbi:MAG: AraC family ligand binding domain-containing protein, partial [Oscillospiraceae bacterium]|nr:AraC family ligand binding domain-containing protein [Oscillospiraceae bacterium]
MYFYDFPIISTESELPLYLVSVGMHELQPRIIREEGYNYPQILYCTKGSGILVLGDKKHEIKPYTAFFLPSGCPHEYYPCEEIWDIRWVVPSGYAAEDILGHFGLSAPKIFTLENINILEHHFRKMHEALIGDKLFGNYRAAGFLYNFLIE